MFKGFNFIRAKSNPNSLTDFCEVNLKGIPDANKYFRSLNGKDVWIQEFVTGMTGGTFWFKDDKSYCLNSKGNKRYYENIERLWEMKRGEG